MTGRYQGDDLGSRVIELGFQRKAVLLMQQTGMTATFESVSGGLAMSGAPVLSWGDEPVVELVSNGFRVVRGNNIYTNHSSYTFHYMAFR